MYKPTCHKLQVPVELVRHAYGNGTVKSLAIYLYLKMYSSGKVCQTDEVFKRLMTKLDMKERTFKKHLKVLLDEDWIGYNQASSMYFIRSFDHLRYKYTYKSRQAVTLVAKDLPHILEYCSSVIINAVVTGQKFVWELKRRGRWIAMHKRDVANQPGPFSFSSQPPYYGICNDSIARLLGCKKTRACVLKNTGAKFGYLIVKHHFQELKIFEERDLHIRSHLNEMDKTLNGKIRFRHITKNGKKLVMMEQQLHDEIIPLIPFKTIGKFNNIHAPCSRAKKISKIADQLAA